MNEQRTVEEQIEWAKNELSKACLNAEELGQAFELLQAGIPLDSVYEEPVENLRIMAELAAGIPLSPITDDPAEWESHPEIGHYYSVRYPFLFCLNEDKTYMDTNKYVFKNVFGNRSLTPVSQVVWPFVSAFLQKEIDRTVLPYCPLYDKNCCYLEEFSSNSDNSGPDTVGILYLGSTYAPPERLKSIMRFFKLDHKSGEWIEINKTEYAFRHKKAEDQNG